MKIIRRRHVDALTLDRFDDERCNVAASQCLFERRQVVERDADAIGQEWAETVAEPVVTLTESAPYETP